MKRKLTLDDFNKVELANALRVQCIDGLCPMKGDKCPFPADHDCYDTMPEHWVAVLRNGVQSKEG